MELTHALRRKLLTALNTLTALDSNAGRDRLLRGMPANLVADLRRSPAKSEDLDVILDACARWRSVADSDHPRQILIENARDLAAGQQTEQDLQAILDSLRSGAEHTRNITPHDAALQSWLDAAVFDDVIAALVTDKTRYFSGREWLLESIAAWLTSATRGMFLLTGEPGTGKTTVAARLVQIAAGTVAAPPSAGAAAPNWPDAVHFCSTRSSDTLDPRFVIGALARQLATRYPAFRQALATGTPDLADLHSVQELWHVLLRKPLAALRGTPVTILIDSLDEAARYPGAQTLVDLLAGSLDWPEVRWICTSRDEGEIVARLTLAHRCDLIRDVPAATYEVRAYAQARLSALDPNPLTPEEQAALADRIAAPNLGNFLYARHLLDDLLPALVQGKNPDITRLPSSLSALYGEFLRRLAGSTSDAWRDRYRPLLGAVATALGEGLDRDTLSGILGQTRQTVSDAVQLCKSYLTLPTPNGPYHIYHQSFADFLTDEQTNPAYWIDTVAAHGCTGRYLLDRWGQRWAQAPRYPVLYTPAHLLAAAAGGDMAAATALERILTDLHYLAARIGHEEGNTWTLEQELDQTLVLRGVSQEQEVLQAFVRALRLESRHMRSDPQQAALQLHNRLWRGDGAAIDRRLAQTQTAISGPWLRPNVPLPAAGALRRILDTASRVRAVAVSADGRVALFGGTDGTVRVWDVAAGTTGPVLPGHTGWVRAVAVSADGRVALTGGTDGTVRVWDVAAGEERAHYICDSAVFACAVSADGSRIVIGTGPHVLFFTLAGREQHNT